MTMGSTSKSPAIWRTCDAAITVTWPDGQVVSFDWDEIGEGRFVTIAYPDVIEK